MIVDKVIVVKKRRAASIPWLRAIETPSGLGMANRPHAEIADPLRILAGIIPQALVDHDNLETDRFLSERGTERLCEVEPGGCGSGSRLPRWRALTRERFG